MPTLLRQWKVVQIINDKAGTHVIILHIEIPPIGYIVLI